MPAEFDSLHSPLREDEDSDWEDDDDYGAEEIACNACGASVYEDAVRCPICGEYLTPSNSVWAGRSWWWQLLGLAGVAAVIASLALL